MPKPFIPKVTRTKHAPSSAMLAWAQDKADAAYLRLRMGEEGLETEAVEICAANQAVGRHTDAEGKDPAMLAGMRIYGLVLRSDGHRLHSDALHAAGVTEGLPLSTGDLYEIDVFDAHWTTVPAMSENPQIVFTVNIMRPDKRSHLQLAHDMWWTVLAASIEGIRQSRAA